MSEEQSKDQLVKQIHALLGIELKTLNRMSKEDLLKLHDILADPPTLAQIAIRRGLQLLLELGEQNESKT